MTDRHRTEFTSGQPRWIEVFPLTRNGQRYSRSRTLSLSSLLRWSFGVICIHVNGKLIRLAHDELPEAWLQVSSYMPVKRERAGILTNVNEMNMRAQKQTIGTVSQSFQNPNNSKCPPLSQKMNAWCSKNTPAAAVSRATTSSVHGAELMWVLLFIGIFSATNNCRESK